MNLTIKAWKDPAFRVELTDADLSALPDNPVGTVEFSELAVDETRGAGSESNITFSCCNTSPITFRSCFTCWDSKWTCRTCWGCS